MPRARTRPPSQGLPISGGTRVVGIVGDPVAHSLSPAMHNAGFRALGLDFVYVAFRVRPAALRAAVRGARALGIAGLNVTVPHKEKVIPLLDELTRPARLAGAVNTVYWRENRLVGDNTDVQGFLHCLAEADYRVRGCRALVVGAGGAARAVVAALLRSGARHILVVNRSTARRKALARHFLRHGARIMTAPLPALQRTESVAGVDLVVNATTLGLHGERFLPLAYAATPVHCLFVDLVYGRKTDFLQRARNAGRPTLDGTRMLLHQGAAAFRRWTGKEPPLDIMARALAEADTGTGIRWPGPTLTARSGMALERSRRRWR